MDGLVSLLIVILVVGLVVWLALAVIDNIPLEPPVFKQITRALVFVIALVFVLTRLLPLAGVAL